MLSHAMTAPVVTSAPDGVLSDKDSIGGAGDGVIVDVTDASHTEADTRRDMRYWLSPARAFAWLSLGLSAALSLLAATLCYCLHDYLERPHPDDDSYYLAATAYALLVPALVDYALMTAFLVGVLWRHPRGGSSVLRAASIDRRPSRCELLLCAALLLLSCWPSGFAAWRVVDDMGHDCGDPATTAACVSAVACTACFGTFSVLWALLSRQRA